MAVVLCSTIEVIAFHGIGIWPDWPVCQRCPNVVDQITFYAEYGMVGIGDYFYKMIIYFWDFDNFNDTVM